MSNLAARPLTLLKAASLMPESPFQGITAMAGIAVVGPPQASSVRAPCGQRKSWSRSISDVSRYRYRLWDT